MQANSSSFSGISKAKNSRAIKSKGQIGLELSESSWRVEGTSGCCILPCTKRYLVPTLSCVYICFSSYSSSFLSLHPSSIVSSYQFIRCNNIDTSTFAHEISFCSLLIRQRPLNRYHLIIIIRTSMLAQENSYSLFSQPPPVEHRLFSSPRYSTNPIICLTLLRYIPEVPIFRDP